MKKHTDTGHRPKRPRQNPRVKKNATTMLIDRTAHQAPIMIRPHRKQRVMKGRRSTEASNSWPQCFHQRIGLPPVIP